VGGVGGEGGFTGGGVDWVGRVGRQHGPRQVLCFSLSLDVLSPEHFICSQSKHAVHCTAVDVTFLVQILQGQRLEVGPGLDSIPALSKSSRRRHAGKCVLSFVR
jgi:hypothetical protein